MIRSLLFAFFVCLLPAVLFAQGEPPKPAKLRFLFIDEAPGHYALKLPHGLRQVSAHPYEISAPFTPANLDPIEVCKTLPSADTGTSAPVKIASFVPPTDSPSALVIITPRPPASPEAAPVYHVEIINSDPDKFPAGSIRIINRSPVSMAGQFNDDRVLTGPGETKLVRPTTDTRNRILYKIAVQVQNAAGWQVIQDNITVVRPTERMIGVLVYSPGGMRHMLTASEIAEMGPPKPGCFWLTFSDSP